MTKKITSIVLVICMVLSCFAVAGFSVSAADQEYYVAGSSADLFGAAWDPGNAAAKLELQADGTYAKTFTATEDNSNVEFKITTGSWVENWGENGTPSGKNMSFAVQAGESVTISFNPTTHIATVTGASEASLDVQSVIAVGNGSADTTGKWLNGKDWMVSDSSNALKKTADGIWEITYVSVPSGTYQFKLAANGSWDANWGGKYTESGAPFNGVYNSPSDNISFTAYSTATVAIKLDITNFDIATGNGAVITVTLTTESAATTAAPEPETTVVEPEPETTVPEPEPETTVPEPIEPAGDSTMYFDASAVTEGNEEFYVWTWNGINEAAQWVTGTADEAGVYKFENLGEKAIFTRQDAAAAVKPDWAAKWLQTEDLTVVDGATYVVTGEKQDEEGKGTGIFDGYWKSDEPETTVPEPEPETTVPEPEPETTVPEPETTVPEPIEPAGDSTMYFDASAVTEGNEEFYVWTWNGINEAAQWVTGTADEAGVYKFENLGEKAIFTRQDAAAAVKPDWAAKWLQTEDLTVVDGATYVVTGEKKDEEGQGTGIFDGYWKSDEPETTVPGPEPETTVPAPQPAGDSTMYFDASAVTEGNEEFYVWTWNGESENAQWVTGTADEAGVYKFENLGEKAIFTRQDAAAAVKPDWTAKWLQTEDLTVVDGATYVVTGEKQDEEGQGTGVFDGYWKSDEPETTAPVPETTVPLVEGITVSVAAPTSTYAASYAWNNAVLFYGDTAKWDDMTQIAMQDSGDVYYTAETFNSTIITPGAWKVYTVTLTDEQATAVSAAKFVGFGTANGVNRTTLQTADNVLKAATGSYSATYGAAASPISDFDGKTFVFAESRYGEKSASSYKGYWTDSYVTVMGAAPVAKTAYSTWDSMSLFYGDTTTFTDMNTVKMVSTGKTTKVTDLNDAAAGTIRNGRWYIYAVTLDSTQAAAVEAAKYVGFCKTDATNRTNLTWNVLKAETGSYTGAYASEARALKDVEGQVFIINSQTKAGSSVATYVGYWATKEQYTQGDADKVTVFFAAPTADKAVYNWDTGVELYYGDSAIYTETTRINMTPTNGIYPASVAGTKLQNITSGNWVIYAAELDVDQINAIDKSGSVGFIKKGSFNRTSISGHRNITKASKTDDTDAYSGYKTSIEAFDGLVFVINDYYSTSEQVSYTGKWHTVS